MSTPAWFRRDLFAGDSGSDVCAAQRLLGGFVSGEMDEDTLARVRGLQRALEREITGVVDHSLALLMGQRATYGLVPLWYEAGDWTELYVRLRTDAVGFPNAVRRFQSHHHLPPTGVIDEATAIALGD